ncbi:hypothetical protein B0684_09295 [Thioalkalivibrio versutus]|nr:hypothetical protein B0684_09295 [Thioalkalivibrio versutus]
MSAAKRIGRKAAIFRVIDVDAFRFAQRILHMGCDTPLGLSPCPSWFNSPSSYLRTFVHFVVNKALRLEGLQSLHE